MITVVQRVQNKLNSLQFLQWLKEFIHPRKTKTNIVEPDVKSSEDKVEKKKLECSKARLDEYSFDENDVSIPKLVPKQSKFKLRGTMLQIGKAPKQVAAKALAPPEKDDFDVFGHYVATKIKKLSHGLTEEAMESVDFNITVVMMRARSHIHAQYGQM